MNNTLYIKENNNFNIFIFNHFYNNIFFFLNSIQHIKLSYRFSRPGINAGIYQIMCVFLNILVNILNC